MHSSTTEDDCKDLKTIQYRTQMLSGKNTPQVKIQSDTSSLVESILEKERHVKRNVIWSRLERSTCISKLNEYAETFGKNNDLTEIEVSSLKKYLFDALNRKKFTKVKDILFDKDEQVIKNIHNLTFNKTTRKFTLRRSDRKSSASSSLGPGRDTRKNKQLL
jgi:hypothetical protein